MGFVTLLAAGWPPAHAAGQSPSGATYESLQRAHEILEAGIQAMGGEATMLAVQDLSLERVRSFRYHGQERIPGVPAFSEGRLQATFDLTRRRVAMESRGAVDSYVFHRRSAVDAANEEGFTANLMMPDPVGALSRREGNSVLADWHEWNRSLPHLALRQAIGRRATLRHIGQESLDGRLHHAVMYTDAGGTPVTLYFDARNHLLTRLETVGTSPMLGDLISAISFSDFQTVAGMRVPNRSVYTENGEVIEESRYTRIVVNAGVGDELFLPPGGYAEAGPSEGGPVLEHVGGGIHLANVSGTHRSMIVEVDDFLVVVEAPLNSDVGERLFELIREAMPSKEIRYVVPTHHHWDHMGGLRPFIAAGVTVLTTPRLADEVRRLAAARSLVAPDALSRAPRPARVETFADMRVLGSGTDELRLIDVGPTSHGDEMVVAYLPGERALFQGDMFFLRIREGRRSAVASEDARRLHEIIGRLGLSVETILGVHGPSGSMSDLVAVVGQPDGWQPVPAEPSS